MSEIRNLDLLIYDKNDKIHLFSKSLIGVSYINERTNEVIEVYENNILEFDADIDSYGNIGLVILDSTGKLIYYFFDGSIWTNHLLYQFHSEIEEISHINIKFSLHSPHITFCWRSLTSPSLWSVMAYYLKDNDWAKELFARVHYTEDIKPYIIIRDMHYNLYLIYLYNNNMIYDLMITMLSTKQDQWTKSSTMCSCIYVKYFKLDALVDSSDLLHISWIDKYKESYCVKYIHGHYNKSSFSEPIPILKADTPFKHQQLLLQKDMILSYAMSHKGIYYLSTTENKKTVTSNWENRIINAVKPYSLQLIRIIGASKNSFIKYQANYIFS